MRMAALALCLFLAAAGQASAVLAPGVVEGLGFTQRLGERVPRDLVLRGDDGVPVRLGSLLDGPPVVLLFADYDCKTLCGTVLGATAAALAAGKDGYRLVVVGIDPKDGPGLAAAMRLDQLAAYPAVDRRATLLTGDAASLVQAVGLRYAYDPEDDQFAHPAGLVVLTQDGRISKYLLDVAVAPGPLAAALQEAGAGGISGLVRDLVLLCYGHDLLKGVHTRTVVEALQVAGVASVLGIGLLVVRLGRRREG